jgi:hypothetical protein
LVVIGVGVAVSNTQAVVEALLARESAFVRTPKRGQREIIAYRSRLSRLTIFEIGMGLYGAVSFHYYISAGEYLVGPFLAVFASAFLFIGFLALAQGIKWRKQ